MLQNTSKKTQKKKLRNQQAGSDYACASGSKTRVPRNLTSKSTNHMSTIRVNQRNDKQHVQWTDIALAFILEHLGDLVSKGSTWCPRVPLQAESQNTLASHCSSTLALCISQSITSKGSAAWAKPLNNMNSQIRPLIKRWRCLTTRNGHAIKHQIMSIVLMVSIF